MSAACKELTMLLYTYSTTESLHVETLANAVSFSEESLSEQYIGCYKDQSLDRAMSHKAVVNKNVMSWQHCTGACSSANYSFSGAQFSHQCFCGESYARHGPVNEINCSTPCRASTDMCGGVYANSVLHTCPSRFYGLSCAKACNCQTGRCFFHNGTCQESGCESGWTGDACSLRDCNVNNGNCDAGELCVTVEPIVNRRISVCRCPDGYGKTTIGGNCTDIDECKEFPRICGPFAASCDNINGGYACRCLNGKDVNNSHCEIDAVSDHYVGCFHENKTLWNVQNIKNVETVDSCIYHCLLSNHSYARLLNSTRCLCANKRGIQLQEPACNIACKNSSGQNCSGTLYDQLPAYTLYTACPIGFYGVECKTSCNCKNGILCDRQSGKCPGQCYWNYTGEQCNKLKCGANDGNCKTDELCVTVEPIRSREISVCQCKAGFWRKMIGETCTDVDECSEIPDICGPYSRSCSNTEGSYTCHCRNGNNITASLCTSDINECTDNPGICGPYGKSCVNTEGSFTCHCLNGSTVGNSSCSSDVLLEHYLGCFYISGTQWESRTEKGNLRGGRFLDSGNRTFEHCIEHCKQSEGSYSYARMQSGSYCECVAESGLQVNDSLCSKTCEGNSSQHCGGMMFNLFPTYILYAVCPFGTYGSQCEKACHCEREVPCDRKTGKCPGGCHRNYTGAACSATKSLSKQYIGCYGDKSSKRAMPYSAVDTQAITYMLLQRCTDMCSSASYSFSGAQFSRECFCGESYKKHGTLHETGCNMTCSGNNAEICGGPGALSVYHSCPSGNYGRNCAKVCNCKEGRCFFQNGNCQVKGMEGCKLGWTGNTCALRDCIVNNGSCDAGELCVTVEPIVNRTISVCRCPDGYGKTSIGGNCTDIDECTEYSGICGPFAASCDNINGGYACRCLNGETVNNSHCKIDVVLKHYVGCFHENKTLWNVQNIKSVETVDSCISHCLLLNHSYARLLNSTRCLCANESGMQLQEPVCNIAYKNSTGQNCSGPLYDQLPAYVLYTACPIGFYGVECKTSCNCKNGIPCDRQSGKCPGQCYGNDTEDQCNNLKCGANDGNCKTDELCVTVEPIRSREISVCQCKAGFWRKMIGETCTDVDECSEIPDICGPYSRSCSNTEGSYTCHCQNGNNITASLCTSDINECTDNPGICGPYGKSCVNTEGSFTCHCLNGSTVGNSSCSSDVLLEHYLGCFYNNDTQWQNRIERGNLTGGEFLESDNRTFEQCIEHCKESEGSYSYARMQRGSYCECVDESGLQVNDSLCNKTCEENSSQYCDGMMFSLLPTSILYSVCPFGTYGSKCEKACHCEREVSCDRKTGKCPGGCHRNYTGAACSATKSLSEQYIGCYGDKNANRSMSYTVVVTANNYMSLRWCTDFCSSANYSFSGPQFGYECFCGESYKRHGKLSQETCKNPCSGNKKEICGGPGALSVYHSCPFGNYGRNCSKICNCEEGRCFFQNGTCQVKGMEGCKPGWTGNTCALRDCNVNNGSCDAEELCVTVEPIVNRTISVCRCPDGYGKASIGGNCTDIDECFIFPGICGPHSRSCSNSKGSYTCHCQNGKNTTASVCTLDAENVNSGSSLASVFVPIIIVVAIVIISVVVYFFSNRRRHEQHVKECDDIRARTEEANKDSTTLQEIRLYETLNRRANEDTTVYEQINRAAVREKTVDYENINN